ncbi:MAG: NADH:flavin oxidoreductase/NADH oxidase, partial [Dehalococcoidia bacterium]|nr:NADH:flavin oxidoreductase/NADH oxidase [Dehalococcoidia bacterium]
MTTTNLTHKPSETAGVPLLFTPYTLRGITFRNRLVVSPMCQYACESQDGLATAWHLVHLGSRAVGGAGLVIAEATAVSPEGRISPQDLGLWSDAHAKALKPAVDFVRAQGAAMGVQLAHAGRKASTKPPWDGRGAASDAEGGWDPIAPSALAFTNYRN